MKPFIVIDAIHAEPGGTGLARYAREVTRLLIPALQTDYRVVVVATAAYQGPRGDRFIEAPASVSPVRGGRGHVYRLLWRWFVLPRRLAGMDVVRYYAPVPEPAGIRAEQVLTVHDLIPLQYPRLHWKQVWLFWLQLRLVARKASTVIAISHITEGFWKSWIGDRFHGETRVVHNGIHIPEERPADTGERSDEPPFILYVGDTRPYKGVDTLVRALAHTRTPVRLKIAGKVNPAHREQLESVAAECSVGDRLIFCGYVGDDELISLYRNASALGLATRAEGFGLVPLEAMLWGTPVVVSDIPVLREVLGDHADFVPVGEPVAWGAALDRAVAASAARDEATRKALIDYACSFAWARTVDRIRAVLTGNEEPVGQSAQRGAAEE